MSSAVFAAEASTLGSGRLLHSQGSPEHIITLAARAVPAAPRMGIFTKMLLEHNNRLSVRRLLSKHNSNPKIAKAETLFGIRTAVLHLAPADMSGYEVCPSRSPGCTAACLHHAGNPVHQHGKNRARIERTRFFFNHREEFLHALRAEIERHKRAAHRKCQRAAVRLNGTSDLPWERIRASFGSVIDAFPDVSFYDYTSVINRLRVDIPENYHLTFSLKENNEKQAIEAIDRGFNVAVVFGGNFPDTFMGLPVIDGDAHDYRPTDPYRCIVGLRAKGAKGKADTSGFVHAPDESVMLMAA